MARETVKIIDKDLRLSFKRLAAQASGKRAWREMSAFNRIKNKDVDEQWQKNGIDETGRTGVWPKLSPLTIRRRRYGPKGVGRNVWTEIAAQIKPGSEQILQETGKLRESVKSVWTKKKRQ